MTTPNHASENASEEASVSAAKVRLLSLDAYRGLIMLQLASVSFGAKGWAMANLKTDSDSHAGFWNAILQQVSHAQWVGCNVHDMIQPSFMFMVGVAMAYSYAKRRAMGDTFGGNVPLGLLGPHNGSLCWRIWVSVGYCLICHWMVRQKTSIRNRWYN